jgi:hypothetical protein
MAEHENESAAVAIFKKFFRLCAVVHFAAVWFGISGFVEANTLGLWCIGAVVAFFITAVTFTSHTFLTSHGVFFKILRPFWFVFAIAGALLNWLTFMTLTVDLPKGSYPWDVFFFEHNQPAMRVILASCGSVCCSFGTAIYSHLGVVSTRPSLARTSSGIPLVSRDRVHD